MCEVIRPFTDRVTGTVYLTGQSYKGPRVKELADKGFVKPATPAAAPVDTDEGAQDLERMTAAALKRFIAAHGGKYPSNARKGELLLIAQSLQEALHGIY